METFIFYTGEGTTTAPDGTEAENLQILGIETGCDAGQALQNLLDAAPGSGTQAIRRSAPGSAPPLPGSSGSEEDRDAIFD